MTRIELWLIGKPVHVSERIVCGTHRCGNRAEIREFDFGYFCKRCLLNADGCSTPGCTNPIQYDPKLPTGRCRSCEFDYSGELEYYGENHLSAGRVWAPGKQQTGVLKRALDRAITRHKIPAREPRKNWFPPPREGE